MIQLQELVRVGLLDAIFTAFYFSYSNCQSFIDRVCERVLATDDKYPFSSVSYDVYFDFEKLLWKGEIERNDFSFEGIKFKGVDIKLINDGFIYTHQDLDDNLTKCDIGSWHSLLADVISQSFPAVLEFAKRIGLSNKSPFFYRFNAGRLDIHTKDFVNRLSLSVTYDHGSPTYDFDDYWEDLEPGPTNSSLPEPN
jgi:hypothetical protein